MLKELTEKEHSVMRLICQGKSNAEIASDLDLSVNTVKTHLRHVFKKLEVDNRTAATVRYLRVIQ